MGLLTVDHNHVTFAPGTEAREVYDAWESARKGSDSWILPYKKKLKAQGLTLDQIMARVYRLKYAFYLKDIATEKLAKVFDRRMAKELGLRLKAYR